MVSNGIFRGRDAIEGLIPRDGAVSAALHLGVGIAAGGAALGMSTMFPDRDPARPDEFSSKDFRDTSVQVLALATAPLFLTAGMQLASPTERTLARGINPNYFMAAGALLGAGFIVHAVGSALDN